MQEFNKYQEVKYVSIWFLIVSIIIGETIAVAKFLDMKDSTIIYLIIIILLLVFIWFKSREAEHYKKQLQIKENERKK